MNGRSALRAVYNEPGIESGRVSRNGVRIEGVDSWRELEVQLASIMSEKSNNHTLELCIRPRHGVLHVPMLEQLTPHLPCHRLCLHDQVVKQSTRCSQPNWCWRPIYKAGQMCI
jgi:hypothetical protein